MRPPRERIQSWLSERQRLNGGYTGEDLAHLARELGLNLRTLNRYLQQWVREDPCFRELTYLGRRSLVLTLDDYTFLEWRVRANPSEVKSTLLSDLNERRTSRGVDPVPKTTYYRIVGGMMGGGVVPRPSTTWLASKGITVGPEWDFVKARSSLESVFTYDDLKFYHGISTEAFSKRLDEAEALFGAHYPGTDPLAWYLFVSPRSKLLTGQLGTIGADELFDVQARLAFEAQVCFLVEGYDRFLDEMMRRRGRMQQSRNAARAALERGILLQWVEKAIPAMEAAANGPEAAACLSSMATEGKGWTVEARRKLLAKHREQASDLFDRLSHRTGGFAGLRLKAYGRAAEIVLGLARNLSAWATLDHEDKRKVIRDEAVIEALDGDNGSLVKTVVLDHFLDLLKSGKIADNRSWRYGDLGARLSSLPKVPVEETVTTSDVEELAAGTYRFPPIPEFDPPSDAEEDDSEYSEGIPVSSLLGDVAALVAERNPGWFDAHREVFRRQTDGMFQLTYPEEEYRRKLYLCIGFLGRNLRYSDAPEFPGLKYFVQRVLSDEILDLEMHHVWNVIKELSGEPVTIIVVDTMGIDARRKSIFATLHGRYHTIGFSDLRAISHSLVPVYSKNTRSTDSEAMNIIPVLAHARNVLGDELQWYTGNGHTVSRLAAGLAFAAFKVIAAGRIHGEPKKPGPKCMARLVEQQDLINRMGQLLRSDPNLGRMLASRQHVYVDGVNVRRLLEDLGSLVLWAQQQRGIKLDHLAQLIETSNRQKRVVRIMERGVTRVHEENVSLVLKAAELILCDIAAWKLYQDPELPGTGRSPVSLDGITLFRPA